MAVLSWLLTGGGNSAAVFCGGVVGVLLLMLIMRIQHNIILPHLYQYVDVV